MYLKTCLSCIRPGRWTHAVVTTTMCPAPSSTLDRNSSCPTARTNPSECGTWPRGPVCILSGGSMTGFGWWLVTLLSTCLLLVTMLVWLSSSWRGRDQLMPWLAIFSTMSRRNISGSDYHLTRFDVNWNIPLFRKLDLITSRDTAVMQLRAGRSPVYSMSYNQVINGRTSAHPHYPTNTDQFWVLLHHPILDSNLIQHKLRINTASPLILIIVPRLRRRMGL